MKNFGLSQLTSKHRLINNAVITIKYIDKPSIPIVYSQIYRLRILNFSRNWNVVCFLFIYNNNNNEYKKIPLDIKKIQFLNCRVVNHSLKKYIKNMATIGKYNK
jgi:hypothetical protein